MPPAEGAAALDGNEAAAPAARSPGLAAGAPFYATTCAEPVPDAPPLAGPIEAKVAIVGGGLAGLAVALSLAERGVASVVLEAGEIAGGASGRSGGMVSAGFTRGTLALERAYGTAAARALHGPSQDALATIRARVARHGIVDGVLVAAMLHDAAALAQEAAALGARFGMRLEVVDRGWMRAHYATEAYRAGLLDLDGFHLDPLALARGYARAAIAQGARIAARTPVTGLVRQGRGWRLATADGRIDAEHVVLATSAYGDALVPRLRRALLPVVTYVIVTEPLGGRLAGLVAAPYAVYDDRFATGYWRPLADGRLLWGGRLGLAERPRGLAQLMRRDLAAIFPQLADVPVASAWSGRMGFARHKMPLLGRLGPGLWVSSAHGGHGLNGTTMGGELLARAILDDDPAIDAFARFRPVPAFGPLGRLAAQAIWRGHGLKERLARRA
jgi:gamma-glutamylputrescine oxidase